MKKLFIVMAVLSLMIACEDALEEKVVDDKPKYIDIACVIAGTELLPIWYIGQSLDGETPHGKGVQYYGNGDLKYVGMWQEGRWHGVGKEFWKNGDNPSYPYWSGMFRNYNKEYSMDYYEVQDVLGTTPEHEQELKDLWLEVTQ